MTGPKNTTEQDVVAEMDTSKSLETLQTSRQRQILDIVDKLRTCGLGTELSLPQLVVCGDQSAGKSSVLEALTEINFPRADELCTRFATEIILRRSASEGVVVKIIPDSSRSAEEEQEIKSFTNVITDFSTLTSQLASVTEEAQSVMGIGTRVSTGDTRTFARDVLSIEISGPNRPQLTVVDLPGLIQNENKGGDKALVEELTMKYISQSRTICLPVITAMNDADNQRILTLVKEADPDGSRSIGIITKPDTLPKDSGSERAFIELASNANRKYFFKRGWHVLKNRKFEESGATLQERNSSEIEFFRTSNFRVLPKTSVGIEFLGKRLSSVLLDHIKSELPGMRDDIERMLSNAEHELRALGNGRGTLCQCRDYLLDVADRIHGIGKSALHGNYDDEFFHCDEYAKFDPSSQWAVRRLRAVIQYLNDQFAIEMRLGSHRFHITKEESVESAGGDEGADHAPRDALSLLQKKSRRPIKISHDVALVWAKNTIARTRGRELQGNFNPLVIGELYRIQSRRWSDVAEEHIENVARVCSEFVLDVLQDSSANDVCNNVWTLHLEEALKTRKLLASESLKNFVRAFQDYPINHNHYYTDTVQRIRRDKDQERLEQASADALIWKDCLNEKKTAYVAAQSIDPALFKKSFTQKTEADMLKINCEEALDSMRAIYKVKQKVFVDVVITLVVEEHLVRGLHEIFTPKVVSRLSEDAIQELALEPESIRNERIHFQDQLGRLREGQGLLRSIIGIAAK